MSQFDLQRPNFIKSYYYIVNRPSQVFRYKNKITKETKHSAGRQARSLLLSELNMSDLDHSAIIRDTEEGQNIILWV